MRIVLTIAIQSLVYESAFKDMSTNARAHRVQQPRALTRVLIDVRVLAHVVHVVAFRYSRDILIRFQSRHLLIPPALNEHIWDVFQKHMHVVK